MESQTIPPADPLAFPPVMTMEDFGQAKKVAQESSTSRNVAFMMLTRTGHDLAGFAWKDGDTFIELMQCIMDYQTHLEGELEMVKCAVARMIAVGRELSENGKPSYVEGEPATA